MHSGLLVECAKQETQLDLGTGRSIHPPFVRPPLDGVSWREGPQNLKDMSDRDRARAGWLAVLKPDSMQAQRRLETTQTTTTSPSPPRLYRQPAV